MRNLRLVVYLAAAHAAFGATATTLLHSPALSRTRIAFSYAGDLWTVNREGGTAVRLTTGIGIETLPVFSPDGETLAFTGEYDGNVDVYTIPASGACQSASPITRAPITRWDGHRTASESCSAPTGRVSLLATRDCSAWRRMAGWPKPCPCRWPSAAPIRPMDGT